MIISVLQSLIAGSSPTASFSRRSLPVIVCICTVSEVSPLPGKALEDGYDDVTEAPGPKDASLSGQNEQEITGIPEENDGNKDSRTGEARRAALLVFIIYSYYTEPTENQGGGYLKGSPRFYLTTVRKEHYLLK